MENCKKTRNTGGLVNGEMNVSKRNELVMFGCDQQFPHFI